MESKNNVSGVKMHDDEMPSSIVSVDRNMNHVKESTPLVDSDKENIAPSDMNAMKSTSHSPDKSTSNITFRQSIRKNTFEKIHHSDGITATSIDQDKENRAPDSKHGGDIQLFLSPSFVKVASSSPRPALRRSTRKSTIEKTRQTDASVTARALKSKDHRIPYNDAQSFFAPSFSKSSTSMSNVQGTEEEESNTPHSPLCKGARIINATEEDMNKSHAIAAAYTLLEKKGASVTKTSNTGWIKKETQPIPLCLSALVADSMSPSNVQRADQKETAPSSIAKMPDPPQEEWFNNKGDIMVSPSIGFKFKQESSIVKTDDFDLAASKVHPVPSPREDFSQLSDPSPPRLLSPNADEYIPCIPPSASVVTNQSQYPEPPVEWKRHYFNRPLPSATEEEKWAWLEDTISFIYPYNSSSCVTMVSPIQRMRPLPAVSPTIGTHPRGAFSTTAKMKGQPKLG